MEQCYFILWTDHHCPWFTHALPPPSIIRSKELLITSRDKLKARTETRHSKKWRIALLPRTNLVRESTSNRTQVGWRGCVLQLMQGTSEGWWRLFSTFHIFHGLSNTSPRWQIELIFVLLPLFLVRVAPRWLWRSAFNFKQFTWWSQ